MEQSAKASMAFCGGDLNAHACLLASQQRAKPHVRDESLGIDCGGSAKSISSCKSRQQKLGVAM